MKNFGARPFKFQTSIQQENEETGQNYPVLAAVKRSLAYHCKYSLAIFHEKVLFCCLFRNFSPHFDDFVHKFYLRFTFGNE